MTGILALLPHRATVAGASVEHTRTGPVTSYADRHLGEPVALTRMAAQSDDTGAAPGQSVAVLLARPGRLLKGDRVTMTRGGRGSVWRVLAVQPVAGPGEALAHDECRIEQVAP